ncbi:MAG: hypothetical protein ACE5E8_10275 [Acidimicrobiia bacterium]
MSTHLRLIGSLDELFAAVVADPTAWDADALAAWVDGLDMSAVGRGEARWLRRGVRAAARLARYWSVPGRSPEGDDWGSAVDMALGSRGWVASYELAKLGAEQTLDRVLFDEMVARFRLVRFEPFPMGYECWVALHSAG